MNERAPMQGLMEAKLDVPAVESIPQQLDLSALKLHSIHQRTHLAEIDAFAHTPDPGASFAAWFSSLPRFLGADRLRAAVEAILAARHAGCSVALAMGGHVVKVGCGPLVTDLMRRGFVTSLACNGAAAIHDVEIAMIGATSEDVGDTIRDGRFGMVRETAEFFAQAASHAADNGIGYGASIGHLIQNQRLPHASLSVLAAATEMNIPITVHVAIGTDTVHMPAFVNGAEIGHASLADFRIVCGIIQRMGAKTPGGPAGVWFNIGSAVILPEVFLKAVAVARNLGANLDSLRTINLDQIRHYRPTQNVLGRTVSKEHGIDLVGQHEVIFPLLRQALVELEPTGRVNHSEGDDSRTISSVGGNDSHKNHTMITKKRVSSHKILSEHELLLKIGRHRKQGETIVFTNGCFDLLHQGHQLLLARCKELGDLLVVAVNSDASVRTNKGPGRPIQNEADRAAMLAAFECVDCVTIFEQETPLALIKKIRPDVLAKGGDYAGGWVCGREFVEVQGGKVMVLPLFGNHSTTELVERIRGQDRKTCENAATGKAHLQQGRMSPKAGKRAKESPPMYSKISENRVHANPGGEPK